jgi:alkanesulfonate monooxygenase SsuD/methylene tetrahydromethanopterin reductase-like flavin-dependent oxidoreductase (luciferase family)
MAGHRKRPNAPHEIAKAIEHLMIAMELLKGAGAMRARHTIYAYCLPSAQKALRAAEAANRRRGIYTAEDVEAAMRRMMTVTENTDEALAHATRLMELDSRRKVAVVSSK